MQICTEKISSKKCLEHAWHCLWVNTLMYNQESRHKEECYISHPNVCRTKSTHIHVIYIGAIIAIAETNSLRKALIRSVLVTQCTSSPLIVNYCLQSFYMFTDASAYALKDLSPFNFDNSIRASQSSYIWKMNDIKRLVQCIT